MIEHCQLMSFVCFAPEFPQGLAHFHFICSMYPCNAQVNFFAVHIHVIDQNPHGLQMIQSPVKTPSVLPAYYLQMQWHRIQSSVQPLYVEADHISSS